MLLEKDGIVCVFLPLFSFDIVVGNVSVGVSIQTGVPLFSLRGEEAKHKGISTNCRSRVGFYAERTNPSEGKNAN